jgi:thymidine phosphorylase
VTLARDCGVNARAMLTDMNAPVGRAAGNWLEVKESVECLEGRGPDDLKRHVIDCAAHLLVQTRKVPDVDAARRQADSCLASGEPRRKWDELLVAQGADLDTFRRKLALEHTAPVVREIKATRSGFVVRCDARLVGEVVRDLGGGRLTKDTVINPDVGVDALARPGERLAAGAVLCRIHAANEASAAAAAERLVCAWEIADIPPAAADLIQQVI